jgi:hypothetical protein
MKGNSPVAGGSLKSKPARWIPWGNPPRRFFFVPRGMVTIAGVELVAVNLAAYGATDESKHDRIMSALRRDAGTRGPW